MKHFTIVQACLIAGLTLLAGCVNGPSLQNRPFFHPPAETSPDQATLYFYRNAVSLGRLISPTILINGKAISRLPSGSYFKVNLPAGHYHVESTSPPIITNMVNKQFDLDVEKGRNYFIADQVNTVDHQDGQTLGQVDESYFRPNHYFSRYALVPAEQALQSIKWCQSVLVGDL
ncbi:DUF2846 domain-containing protein [Pseudomonas batumici]|uniref:DUF2846 domain-containing protein n=1 Tax=Pseudomonas batumici TaxID=226910 RepID=UPI0030D293FF